MYRRRFTRRFRGRTSLRFRPRTRVVTPPRKWEVGLIAADDTTAVDNSSDARTAVYTHIASIGMSLGNETGSSDTGRVGTTIASMQRYIEIGGLVFDWDVSQSGLIDGGAPLADDGIFWCTTQLLTDNLAEDSGTGLTFPASLPSYDPDRTTFPMAILSGSSPAPEQRQVRLPTRIHWSKTRSFYATGMPVVNVGEGELTTPWGQRVTSQPATVNRRLRVRLDDQQALFFAWFFRTNTSPDFASNAGLVRRWLRGQIYYRYVT